MSEVVPTTTESPPAESSAGDQGTALSPVGAISTPEGKVDKPNLPTTDRDSKGQCARGNTANTVAKRGGYNVSKQAKLRASILASVTPERLATIVGAMIAQACGGDVHAARLILEYSLGKPLPGDILERISRIEGAMDLPDDLDPEAIAGGVTVQRTEVAAVLFESVESKRSKVEGQLSLIDAPQEHEDAGHPGEEGR